MTLKTMKLGGMTLVIMKHIRISLSRMTVRRMIV
jgi:hypothetical protein